MFGQIVAFLAVATSVAFAACENCYSGYGVYVNAEPGLPTGIPRGCYRSRILTETPFEFRAAPVEVSTPIIASRACSTPIVSSRIVSAPVEVSTPIVATRGCSSSIVSSGVVSAPVEINAAPVISSGLISSPVVSSGLVAGPLEARESSFLAVRPSGRFVSDICDSCRSYATPLYRGAVGSSEVYSSCENSIRPVVVSSGLQTIGQQGSVLAC